MPGDNKVKSGRRAMDSELVTLGFKETPIEEIVPTIISWTGKVVMFQKTDIGNAKITLVNDVLISKERALDYLFEAFRLNGMGVVETPDTIIIETLTDLSKVQPLVVLGPDDDVSNLSENGNIVIKLFQVKRAKATDLHERIAALIPDDYAKFEADANSNQLLLQGDIGLARKVQALVAALDVETWVDHVTKTFRLEYQDAQTIADLIYELFPDSSGQSSRSNGGRNQAQRGQNRGQNIPGGQQAQGGGASGGSTLIVTVLPTLNSLTVRTTPDNLAQIERLVREAWDLPPNTGGSIFRTYDLEYADPGKIKGLLSNLLNPGASSQSTGGNRAIAGGRMPQSGGESGAGVAVANIFQIESYPESNRLVVISKTPENFEWLDRWIKELDQPFTTGVPVNIPLKYASAIKLAEILNTLLAQTGAQTTFTLPEEGLTGIADSFNEEGSSSTGGAAAQGQQQNAVQFPWQGGVGRGGANGADEGESSGLIGRARVVPNAGQNSLLVLAPPEVQKKLEEIIIDLDKPGKQVMITAVLAEVSLGDGFSYGAAIGRLDDFASPLNGATNSVTGNIGLTLDKGGTGNTNSNFAYPWFDSSELNITTSDQTAFFMQALASDSDVRILQQPRIVTSDNKEAKFFAGRDVSLLTGETSGFGTTGTTASYNQTAVGIGLNVRPRITQDNNVNMEIEILLSNLSAAIVNSNPIIERRQTNTEVTLKNGQTIIISGIRREQETKKNRRIPFLGDIPIIGAAFALNEIQNEVVELVVFLTPVVIENPDANDHNYNVNELLRLRELSEPLDKSAESLIKGSKFFDDLRNGKDLVTPVPDLGEVPGAAPLGDATAPNKNP
ncbi:MAG: hypothetical protein EXS10_00200 [Phycisphaerales bacterium]|nr:hypothetical protein [Phycisphaerales bacterium]